MDFFRLLAVWTGPVFPSVSAVPGERSGQIGKSSIHYEELFYS